MKILLLIGCLLSTFAAATCSEDDLFCIRSGQPDSPQLEPQNGQLVGESIQTAISGYAQVGNLLDQAAVQRYNRYAPSRPPTGYSQEQIQQFRADHQRDSQQRQEAFQKKTADTFAVPRELKESFRDANSKQKAILDTLRSIKIPETKIPEPKPADSQKPVLDSRGLLKEQAESEPILREATLSTHPLSQEGKEVRRVINRALVLKTSVRREFIIGSALKADLFFLHPDSGSPQAARRWLERANHAYTYWTDQPEKSRLSTESLGEEAKQALGLGDISADTFERYEIIRAAKLLSFEPKLMQHGELRLQASLSIKQALIYADDGDTDLVIQMTENVYAIKDFLKGFAGGVRQNIYDTATGLWHTVTHPVDSVEALSNAIVNYRATYDLISNKFHQVIGEYPTYTHEQKGELIGKLTSEVFTLFAPVGTLKVISKTLRLESAIEHLAEKMASSHASNIATARKLADQLGLESAKSPFTETGKLTNDAIKTSREIKTLLQLKNPAIPSGFSKFSTETFHSPAGNFKIHFYKNLRDGGIFYDLDYKTVFNIPFGQR